MNNRSTSENILVQRVIQGDEAAFREIFYRYKDKLFSYCCRFTKSEFLAEDIVQEVLIKIWTDRKKINPDLSFNSYLYTITRNRALDFLRKAVADAKLRESIHYHTEKYHCQTEDQLTYKDIERLVKQAITLLPPQRKRIYQMSREKEMTHKEIARHLGISKNTVKNQLVKALKTIRAYLDAHTELVVCLFSILSIFL